MLNALPRALNREQSVTMSASSNDADDLSLSCSVSTVKSEESEVSVEGDLETVEPRGGWKLAISDAHDRAISVT